MAEGRRLATHLAKSLIDFPYVCQACSECFKFRSLLCRHFKSVTCRKRKGEATGAVFWRGQLRLLDRDWKPGDQYEANVAEDAPEDFFGMDLPAPVSGENSDVEKDVEKDVVMPDAAAPSSDVSGIGLEVEGEAMALIPQVPWSSEMSVQPCRSRPETVDVSLIEARAKWDRLALERNIPVVLWQGVNVQAVHLLKRELLRRFELITLEHYIESRHVKNTLAAEQMAIRLQLPYVSYQSLKTIGKRSYLSLSHPFNH